MTQEQKLEFRDTWLAKQWRNSIESAQNQFDYDLGKQPDIPLDHFPSARELGPTLAQCFTDAGYPARGTIDGGVEHPNGVASSPLYLLTSYECYAKFTPDPTILQDWSADQLGLLYDYRVEWLTPCLESFGLQVADPPMDKNTFVNTFFPIGSEASRWSPEGAIGIAPNADEISEACPSIPVDYFYGS